MLTMLTQVHSQVSQETPVECAPVTAVDVRNKPDTLRVPVCVRPPLTASRWDTGAAGTDSCCETQG